jgi:hypothetical protein
MVAVSSPDEASLELIVVPIIVYFFDDDGSL